MAEHTEAPWWATSPSPLVIDAYGHFAIATVNEENLDCDANANLIAASPDLLAIAEWVDAWPRINMPDSKRAELRAAIAKARGIPC